MGWERPFLGVSMLMFMLGFAGLPLTGGFFAKFYAFAAAYDTGWWWLMLVGVAATVVSLYYYLAVIRALYMRSPVELQFAAAGGSPPRDALLHAAVFGSLAVTIAHVLPRPAGDRLGPGRRVVAAAVTSTPGSDPGITPRATETCQLRDKFVTRLRG